MRIFLILFLAVTISNAQTVAINTDLIYKVNLPTKKTDKTPVMIILHGYGSDENDLFDIAKSFDPRFMTLSLRGPNPANGQGYCWYNLEFLPDKKFKYDYNQAKESRKKIVSFISNACKAYKLDSTQVFIMGFSQGSIIAYDIALSSPEKIKGVIALSGRMMEETKNIKFDAFKVSNVKFLITHGTMDNVIDFKDGEAAAKYLQSAKNNVTFKSYNIPHSLNGKELNDIQVWLKTNIPADKKPEGKK